MLTTGKMPLPLQEKRGRTDAAIAQMLKLGGKDLYRQAARSGGLLNQAM